MGKLVARIKNKDLPKELKERFSSVEHVRETGRIAIYGIDKDSKKKKRLAVKKLLEYYGHDPEKKQSVKGIWHGPKQDLPVTVIGSYGFSGGEEKLVAREGPMPLSRKDIEWLPSDDQSSGPETLQEQIAALESKDPELAVILESFRTRLDEVLSRNQELEARNQELESRNEELESQLAAYRNGDIKIVPSPAPPESDNRIMSGFNRTTGWIGRKLPRSRQNYESGVLVDHDGVPTMVVEEEWRDGYSQYERRRGTAVLVGALVIGGAAVLAAGLWGEHEEQEGRSPQVHQTIIHKNENPALKVKLKEKEALNSNLKHLLHQKNIRISTLENEEKHEVKAAGNTFYVEPGNGITNEIQDYARAHGYQEVSGGQAWILYENMRNQFGTNLVELPGGGNDTYIRAQGDVGISQPGQAKWPEQVEHFLQNRLSR